MFGAECFLDITNICWRREENISACHQFIESTFMIMLVREKIQKSNEESKVCLGLLFRYHRRLPQVGHLQVGHLQVSQLQVVHPKLVTYPHLSSQRFLTLLDSDELEIVSRSYSTQQNQVNNINYFRFLSDSDFFTSDELCSKVL